MVSARIVLHVRPEKRAEFLSTLSAIIDRTLRLHGCIGSRLATDCDDADGYFLTFEWKRREAFNEFLNSKEMNVLRGMRGLLDAAREVKASGTFGYLDRSLTTPELNGFMRED